MNKKKILSIFIFIFLCSVYAFIHIFGHFVANNINLNNNDMEYVLVSISGSILATIIITPILLISFWKKKKCVYLGSAFWILLESAYWTFSPSLNKGDSNKIIRFYGYDNILLYTITMLFLTMYLFIQLIRGYKKLM